MFREHCTFTNGIYVKDLKRLHRDLNDVIIIDNSPLAFHFDVCNGLPITSFIDDKSDKELFKLDFILESLSQVNDVRMFIPLFVKNQEINFYKAKDLFLVEKRHISHLKHLPHSNTFSGRDIESTKSGNCQNDQNKSESFLQKNSEYFSQDEAKDKREEEKSLEAISKLEDKSTHIKCKTISSIVVKAFNKDKNNLNSEKSKSDQLMTKPLSNLNRNSYITPIQLQTQDKSKGTQLGRTRYSDQEYLNNDNIRFHNNTRGKDSGLGALPTSSSNASKISAQDQIKTNYSQKLASNTRKLGRSLQPHLRSEKSVSSKGENRKLDNSLNKSNARDNSKTSLESKYSKRTANIKICKISRNFKNDSVTSSKILKTSPIQLQSKFSTSKDKKTATSTLKKNSNKILGVKVYQINNSKTVKQPSFGKNMNCSTTPNKAKYSNRINYSSTYTNLKKKTESKEKGNKLSASNTYTSL